MIIPMMKRCPGALALSLPQWFMGRLGGRDGAPAVCVCPLVVCVPPPPSYFVRAVTRAPFWHFLLPATHGLNKISPEWVSTDGGPPPAGRYWT